MATSTQRSRRAYLAVSCLLAATALLGFWSGYFGPVLTGGVRHFWFIHVHAAVFLAWMFLLVAQAAIVTAGKVELHRTIGVGVALWGVVLIVVGVFISVAAPAARVAAGQLQPDIAGLVVLYNLTDMIVFIALFALAIHWRTRPPIHKRLIICATVALTGAAVGRPLTSGTLAYMLVWLAPLLFAIVADWRIERRVYPVFVMPLVVLVLASMKVPLYATSEVWRVVGRALIGPFI